MNNKEKVLFFDLGNSALKYSFSLGREALRTYFYENKEELPEAFRASFDSYGAKRALGCSVGSEKIKNALEKFLAHHDISIDWIVSRKDFQGSFSLFNNYQNPSSLGPDRWLAMIGALSCIKNSSLIVIHSGTATTADAIKKLSANEFSFLGGMIIPGPDLMWKSLEMNTAKIRFSDLSYSASVSDRPFRFPSNTIEAVSLGILSAQLGPINELIERFINSEDSRLQIFVGGGNAKILEEKLKDKFSFPVHLVDNLVLFGLQEIDKIKNVQP